MSVNVYFVSRCGDVECFVVRETLVGAFDNATPEARQHDHVNS